MRHGIILLLCLIVPSSVWSVEFAGGTGEPNDPYQIATTEQLIAMGQDTELQFKNFVLVSDIDLDPNLPGNRVFDDALIARDEIEGDNITSYPGTTFWGVFDGQGHTIANLHIAGKSGRDIGLFGVMGGLVKDLVLTDVAISGSRCGAIAGSNGGLIQGCRVTGRISGIEDVGGVAGRWGDLVDCQAEVKVSGETNVGGLVGSNNGSLIRCKVQAEVNGQNNVGGLVGDSHSNVIDCQVTGVVKGQDNVGGLIGDGYWASIMDCQVTCDIVGHDKIGGLVGGSFDCVIMACRATGINNYQRCQQASVRIPWDVVWA